VLAHCVCLVIRRSPISTLSPYTTLFRSDVTLQKRIVRISNLLYNRGLEKASVRDLSGAITCLKQSLKFNKENIDARNLLGLCYLDRKSTRLNSSHVSISYAVFCLTNKRT